MNPRISQFAITGGGFPQPVAPGEIISIYGLNLGLESPAGLSFDAEGRVASELQGTRVLFDGVPAPLLYVSNSQINVIVPYEVAGKQLTTIRVERNRLTNAAWGVPVISSVLGIFRVLNQDNSANSEANRTARGSIIQIFATGEGQTSPPGVTGSVTHADLRKPVLPVTVTIGGVEALVQYAGSVPESVAGLFQVNVLVPQNLAINKFDMSSPIVLTVGSSSTGSSILVQ